MMRFVSRAHYQQLQHNYEELRRQAHQWEDLARDEINRYDRLLTMYRELALRVPPAPVINPLLPTAAGGPPAPERVPSVVAQAIKDEAQGDPKLARVLWKRARELREENHSPEEIAKEIRRWETTEVEDK